MTRARSALLSGLLALVGVIAVLSAVAAWPILSGASVFAIGATLVFTAGFGFGILTMYAYVSSLGWER